MTFSERVTQVFEELELQFQPGTDEARLALRIQAHEQVLDEVLPPIAAPGEVSIGGRAVADASAATVVAALPKVHVKRSPWG